MPQRAIHQCECPNCRQSGDHPDKELHYKGIKVSDEEMAALNLEQRRVCPNWNYVIKPRRAPP